MVGGLKFLRRLFAMPALAKHIIEEQGLPNGKFMGSHFLLQRGVPPCLAALPRH